PMTAVLAMLAVPAAAQEHHHPPATPEAASPELAAQVEGVRRATERYRGLEAARRDGYRRFGDEGPLMGEHWYHPDLTRGPLDLERPSTLQYATIGGRKVLVGVAYTWYRRPGEPLPEGFAGEGDAWHTHDVARLARAATAERPVLRWVVDRRIARGRVGAGDGRTLLTMVHAWVWLDNPDGLFAGQHRALAYLRAGLPAAFAEGASEEAALGVALMGLDGCAVEVRRTDRLARLSPDQARGLTRVCARRGAEMRAAPSGDAGALNAAGERAWRAYVLDRARLLTAEQEQRMARVMDAVMEPHIPH
ncbi:MAG TPA: hypothetical protein VNP72_07550, partial [Longimicrobium sp.]|nr:hypothetical protein [Longimicrobium sp.]